MQKIKIAREILHIKLNIKSLYEKHYFLYAKLLEKGLSKKEIDILLKKVGENEDKKWMCQNEKN